MSNNGDKFAGLSYNAMAYSIIKWTAMMAGALYGKVDAILMTGGMCNDKDLVAKITEGVEWIAPIFVYPGSFETEAMGAGAMMAGLLVGAGVGILVLFRTNKNVIENLKITGLLYGTGVLCGMIIDWLAVL